MITTERSQATFTAFAAGLRRLEQSLRAAAAAGGPLGVAPPDGAEWFELLEKKLLPQLDFPPLLVVAVVGGTNIGKSLLFNHLAGEVASGVSPLAAGTKHPVGLAPAACADAALLQRLFSAFAVRPWQSADDPLAEADEHRLFWRVGAALPPRLLLLDTPDVDSDVEVNWQRARALRQSADVLVAVLTQQKYNDAAVKQFFRMAVEADKPIVVVFNHVDLQADAAFWPRWLATFCETTGARPELVYVVPHDRTAAAALQLPFYEVGPDGRRPPAAPANPRDDLGNLQFDAIKIRTFRGALRRVLDPATGAAGYLGQIRAAAGQFAEAAAALSAGEMARVHWPTLPASVLVEEIRAWWDAGRSGWSRQIHGFYRGLGRGAIWPIRAVWQRVRGPNPDPLADFRRHERSAILTAVEKLLAELERLAQVGNETLRPRLARLLGGASRAGLLARVDAAHRGLPAVGDDYREFLHGELDAWRAANPKAIGLLRSLDHVAALARPAITIGLFFTGLHLAGDLVGQAAAHAAGTTAGHLATEAAIAGGIAGGGDVLVHTTTEGVRQAGARLFLRLQSRYAQQRADWLARWLEAELLGELLGELRRGAEAPDGPAFREAAAAIGDLSAAAQLE
jgi:hypothetical protein